MPAETPAPRRTGRYCCLAVGILVLSASAAFTCTFFLIGRFLVVEDPIQHAEAIVILSGRMPQRALEAARLYRQGYAPQVWLTRPIEPPLLREMHIAYIGEDFYNTQVLMHEGVPANAVHVLEPTIKNTLDELQVVTAEAQRIGAGAIIVVTSKAHTRRVRTLWRQIAPGRRAVIRAAATDTFEPASWWRSTQDSLDVTREVLGLLNAWAGSPVQPR